MKPWIILFILMHVGLCEAQWKAYVGPMLGMAMSRVTTDTRNIPNTTIEYLVGVGTGLQASLVYANGFTLISEWSYVQRGYKVRKYISRSALENSDETNSSTWSHRSDYLDNMWAVGYTAWARKTVFRIYTGATLGYWWRGKIKSSIVAQDLGADSITKKNVDQSYVFDNEYGADEKKDRRYDVLANVGIEAGYFLGPNQSLLLDLRYGYGLLDRTQYRTEPIQPVLPEYNRIILISLKWIRKIGQQKEKSRKPPESEEQNEEESEQ